MKCSVRMSQIKSGDWFLIIKQTLCTLPFYYFFQNVYDGQASFGRIVLPLIILFFFSYAIINYEFIKSEYDEYMVKEYGNDKLEVKHNMSMTLGLQYLIFGILGAIFVDYFLHFLSFFLLYF